MGNYSGFFSSCTFCVHVIEKPLLIYRILRIFSCCIIHRANPLTSYLRTLSEFLARLCRFIKTVSKEAVFLLYI